MKVYKATDINMQCQGHQFALGVKYEVTGKLRVCEHGFHACTQLFDVQKYYSTAYSRFFECEASEEHIRKDDKSCHRWIILVRELTFADCMMGFNRQNDGSPFTPECPNTNTGVGNIGNNNTGNNNTGNNNMGVGNIGNYNTGNYNIGNYNRGNNNTGNNNTGNYNTGDYHRGNNNMGNNNTGDYQSNA